MARRDTQITTYKTGRIDPTYTNVWAFESEYERETWLLSKLDRPYLNCKYWRLGAPIKLPVSYENSFNVDYVKITNTENNISHTYYCFVTSRAYLSNNSTLFNLELDIVQTYYFTKSVDGGVAPFWQTFGFVSTDTSNDLPPRGTLSEFPNPVPVAVAATQPLGPYKLVVFSSIDPTKLPEKQALSGTVGNSYTAAPAYIIDLNASAINSVISSYNSAGATDAILNMFLVPAEFFTQSYQTITLAPIPEVITKYVPKPTNCDGYIPKNNVLLGYDYTYFTINNNQGETAMYHFEDFNGTPTFELRLSLTNGSPTIFCTPTNYIGIEADHVQRTMKVTQAPTATWLNDSYKIWLAQTQNSRAASINAAQLAIDQAYEAKRESFAANVDGVVDGVTAGINNQLSKMEGTSAADTSRNMFNYWLNGSLIGAGLRGIGRAAFGIANASRAAFNNIFGTNLSTDITPEYLKSPYGGDTLGKIENSTGVNASDFTQLITAATKKMMGIEQAYIYDQRIASSISSYNRVIASYRDKSAIPPTAVGSNAYGDMTRLPQYGFTFITYTPSAEHAEMVDTALSASGHTVNRYKSVFKHHSVFDVVSIKSPYIGVDIDNLPEYARRTLMEILTKGVYLWYIYNGDISDRIGCPYKLENPEVN